MKTVIGAMMYVAGVVGVAHAADTTIKYEVSTDGLNWSTSLNALPGTQIQVRTRVIWTGATQVVGLGQVGFQPVVSGWTAADHLETTAGTPVNPNDALNPSGNGPGGIGPIGSNVTIPSGSVPDVPGAWGRVYPFATSAIGSTSYLRGFLGTGTAAGLLRIARAQVTNWIGVGPTSGPLAANNWSGVGGVTVGQYSSAQTAGHPEYPAFKFGTDVVVFKFGFTLGNSSDARTLSIDTPQRGLYHEGSGAVPPQLFGQTKSSWWLNENDVTFYNSYDSTAAEAAYVNVVPSPGTGIVVFAAGVVTLRRRR